jgi:thiaminase (transcriptional activator TenA)
VTFLDECRAFTGAVWDRYIHHPWIEALFAGQLSEERLEYWLAQDLPYLGEKITAIALPKVPAHNPWAKLEVEYLSRANASRVELQMMEKYGPHAITRWAARPRREAFVNFFVRTVYEGTFGDICCAYYPCYAFPVTFGQRYAAEAPTGLTPRQVAWIKQWVDPFYVKLWEATAIGINEAGEHAADYERERMRWIFLRATNHQIGTFDAAWNLSDPWPGEGDEAGVMATAPQPLQQAG